MRREFEKPLWFYGCDEAQVLPARQYKLHKPRAHVLMISARHVTQPQHALARSTSDLQQEPAAARTSLKTKCEGFLAECFRTEVGWM